MHTRSLLLALPSLALLVAGCPKGESSTANTQPVDAPAETTTATEAAPDAGEAPARVCCESFGYGAMMVKCCESYAWTAPDACVVEEGFVGGGKNIVADELCANAPAN